ncbi:MAG: FHA domain-containing protein [Gemmataceae bacterium]
MDSSTTRKTSSGSAKQAALVIQNGRLRGTRRSFGYPTTFLGSGASSDVRLSVDGISPLHSVVIQANGELILRDLDSLTGTFVNGRKVTNHTLRNNDQVTVGPFQFVVEIPEGTLTVGWSSDSGPKPLVALEVSSREKAALRIQVAAVVAQQAALTDAECRLQQRQTTLEQQQAQLASHLEDKRTRLLEMQTQIQAARQALQQERQEYGRHVEDVKQNLSQAQQELLDEQAEAQATRKRLAKLHMRLRKRFENNWNRGRRDIEQREKNLEVAYQRLQEDFNRLTKEKEQLHNQSARANSEIALARGKLEDQRTTFRNEQRKIQEQQANQLREFRKATQELRMGEKALLEAEKMFHKEKKQAEDYLELLKAEAIGLEYRIQHQRELLAQVQESDQERVGREQGTEDREQQKAKSDGQRANVGKRHSSFDFQASEALPDRNYPLVVQRSTLEGSKGEDLEPRVDQPIRSEISTLNSQLAVPSKDETRTRLQELDAVAGELIDQRAQVLESWEQLLKVRLEWEGQQQSTNREVRELVVKLHQQAQTLLVQEEQLAVTRGSVAEQFE